MKKTESLIRNRSALCCFISSNQLTTDYSITKYFHSKADVLDKNLITRLTTARTWNRLRNDQYSSETFDGSSKTRWEDLSAVIGDDPHKMYSNGPFHWWVALFGNKEDIENLYYHYRTVEKCFLDPNLPENFCENRNEQSIQFGTNKAQLTQKDLRKCEHFLIKHVNKNITSFESDERAAYIFCKSIALYRLNHWFTSVRYPFLDSSYPSIYKIVNSSHVKTLLNEYSVFELVLDQLKKLEFERLSKNHYFKSYGKVWGWSQPEIREAYLSKPTFESWSKLITGPVEEIIFFVDEIKLSDNIIPTRKIDQLIFEIGDKCNSKKEMFENNLKLKSILNDPDALLIDLIELAGKRHEWKDLYSPSPLTKPYRTLHWSRKGETGLDRYFGAR